MANSALSKVSINTPVKPTPLQNVKTNVRPISRSSVKKP